MLRFSTAAALALLSAASARVVTVNKVTTANPTTLTSSQSAEIVTNDETTWVSTTIFQASTSVTTIPTGVVYTEPYSSVSNPVHTVTVSTSDLSQSIDPSSYSESHTIASPTSRSKSSSSSSSTSPTGTTAVSSSPTGSESAKSSGITTSPEGSSFFEPVSSSSGSTGNSVSSGSSSSSSSSATGSSSGASPSSSELSSSFLPSSTLSSSSVAPSSSSTSSKATSSSSAQSSSSFGSSSSTSSSSSSSSIATPSNTGGYNGPIFDAISTSSPPQMFSREDLKISMPQNYDKDQVCQTNKFYGNLLLGGSNLTAFSQPYGVFYSNRDTYFGVGVSYTNASQRVYGPDDSKKTVEYYTNPSMIMSLVLSAKEFTNDNLEVPQVSAMGPFTANATFKTKNCWPNQKLTVPYALGSGFVTGIYDGYTPRLFSQIGITTIVKVKSEDLASGLSKFQVTLVNGVHWNVYVTGPEDFEFKPVNDFEFIGSTATSGKDSIVVQVAVVESNEDSIDSAAGAYAVGASLDGETDSETTTYRIAYDVAGNSKSGTTLLYALPHHVASFSSKTAQACVKDLTVYSSNKGYLTGVLANTLEMQESVSDMPSWINSNSSVLSSDTLKLLAKTVNSELSEEISNQVDQSSTYSAGKAYDKFAYILLVASDVLQSDKTAAEGLERLKSAFSIYPENKQRVNLMYDTLLKGITSSAANAPGGQPLDDFGAPYYNDHHFHYGYMIHTAAVIAYLDERYGDGNWVSENKDWVDSLVRDVANPSDDDSYFPVSRMFDFYSGHSWAHGMFEAGDGKDEESTAEDYNFAYAMKLWGKVSGNQQMEARGDLMLAIMKRSLIDYFYYKDDNTIEPEKIIGNRVAGITFENKIDHTTYFGTNLEYIQGIHMIPLTPASVLVRPKDFVQQEWDSLLSPIIDSLDSGWAGILRANQALFDAESSYDFFASDDFNSGYLDNGASRSWYLAFAALQGGN